MMLGPLVHRLRRLALTPVLVSALLCAAASPAAAAAAPAPSAPSPAVKTGPRVTFGIGPAGPERADARPFLAYGVTAGSQLMDHVAVVNQAVDSIEAGLASRGLVVPPMLADGPHT